MLIINNNIVDEFFFFQIIRVLEMPCARTHTEVKKYIFFNIT